MENNVRGLRLNFWVVILVILVKNRVGEVILINKITFLFTTQSCRPLPQIRLPYGHYEILAAQYLQRTEQSEEHLHDS